MPCLARVDADWWRCVSQGPLDELWFDGGYYPALKSRLQGLITKLQPNATVLGGYGLAPNSLRWVGTEDGLAPYPSWSRTDCTCAQCNHNPQQRLVQGIIVAGLQHNLNLQLGFVCVRDGRE